MSFLVWNNQQDAEDSLAAINTMYGCPYIDENGYRMDQWDIVQTSLTTGDYGFFKPEERLDHTMDELMPALIVGFVDHNEMPDEFVPEERYEGEIPLEEAS